MIDETGKKVWEETFDLWGKPHDRLEIRVVGGAILTNVKPREETTHPEISQPFRFPGQYHDEETGLYYNRYRYYMPGEGMYTQRAPIGLAGGNPTVYGYVFNTLQEIDHFGLATCTPPQGMGHNKGKGHHPLAKKAFEGVKGYDPKKVLTISLDHLKTGFKNPVSHGKITGQQNSLYTKWVKNNPGATLTLNDMRTIEIESMVNVGVTKSYATQAVDAAIAELISLGITAPTRIPWN